MIENSDIENLKVAFSSLVKEVEKLKDQNVELKAELRTIVAGQQLTSENRLGQMRSNIMGEIYSVIEKKTEVMQHNISKVDEKLLGLIDKQSSLVRENEKKLISLWDNHEMTKKIQYAVAIAVVGAILKASGVV